MSKKHEIAAFYAERIVAGDFRPGSRLPSNREVAELWNVARGTASDAIGLLERQGLVSVVHGAGSFVLGAQDQLRTQIIEPLGPDENITITITISACSSAPAVIRRYTQLLETLTTQTRNLVHDEVAQL